MKNILDQDLTFSEVKKICHELDCKPIDLRHLSDDYLCLTDDEALDAVTDSICESVAYFNAWFLASETDLPESVFKSLAESHDHESVLKLIEKTCGLESFVQSAISADGIGHFLASYGGNEINVGRFNLYRIN